MENLENKIDVIFVLLFCLSHSPYSVPPEAPEAGTDQRLPSDGGGVHQKPGADETPGGETGGLHLSLHCLVYFLGDVEFLDTPNFHAAIIVTNLSLRSEHTCICVGKSLNY